MTTTTTAEAPATVDLSGSNGAAPKRRGRPPGSKNKPKTGAKATTKKAPAKRGRPRKAAATKPVTTKAATRARTPRRTRTAVTTVPAAVNKDRQAHVLFIENSGVTVVLADGETFTVSAPVILDRRG